MMNLATLKRFGLSAVALAAFLCFQPSFSVARADAPADNAELAVTQASSSVDVTIFGDGFGQVEETRQVTLKAGKNRIQLNGIAAKYRLDSLRIIDVKGAGDFKYKSATYQPPTLTTERILEANVGEEITVSLSSGATSNDVTGTLISVRNGQLIIKANDGTTVIASSSDRPRFKKLPAGLSDSASLVLEADASAAGVYNLHLLYETDGMSWSAKHSLVYDEANNNVETFESTVNVVNQSGTSFENANLWLLSGAVQQYKGRGVGAMRMAEAAYAPAMAADAPAVESVGERKVYRIPGRVSLGDNQARQIPLFSGKNVQVEKEFYVPAQQYYGESEESQVPVSVRLKLRNCVEHHLGTPLPAGTVKVYQRNSESKLQLTASTNVKELAKDEAFELQIGTSSDVKAQRRLVKTNTITGNTPVRGGGVPEWEEQTYEVTVRNYKDLKGVDVTIEVNVPADQQTINPLIRKTGNLATGSLHVDARDNNKLTYTLKIRTR